MRLLACLVLVAAPATATAYEIQSPLSEPCHEEITLEAARAAGFPDFAGAPAPTEEQTRAMADLTFDLPENNVWMLALMIGARAPDIEDRQPTDIASLAHIHDDPAQQAAHCIRRQEDDGPAGDAAALDACRDVILTELAAGGLLEETLDLEATEQVPSYFKFRGEYTITLPAFAYRLGRALHAVEDGYAHTMRDPETGNVRHVLNWIDAFGSSSYDEATDGHPHLSGLDDCRRTDEVQLARLGHTHDGVTAIIAAIADPAPGRRARVEAAITAALALTPNCTIDNGYCDAPELAEPDEMRTFGCQVAGASSLAVGVVLLFLLRRRKAGAAAATSLALVVAASTARAEPAPTPPPAAQPALALAAEPEPMSVDAVPAKDLPAIVQDRARVPRWHLDARFGGAWDDASASGALGIAVDYKRWTFGVLGEWNPWLSMEELGSARAGVANLFLTTSYRWYHSDRIAIATRVEAGGSMMLFDLLGIDKYTTGLYVGGALATIRFPLGETAALTFDPIHFALPAPRPFGLPFYYKQYRVTLGLEVAL